MRLRKINYYWLIVLLCSCADLFASDAATEAEVSAASKIFSGYFGESIWTLIWFAVLVFVLKKVAWKPLLAGLQAREDHITTQIKNAEDTRQEAKNTLERYQKKLADADVEGKALVNQQMMSAQAKAQDLMEKARKEAEQIKLRAKEDIDRARQTAENNLVKEAGSMVFELGSEILGRSISAEDNERLIDEAVGKYQEKKQGGIV